MGSCVSVHKSSQDSAMKVGHSFGSKTDNLIIPPSRVKEKPDAANDYLDPFFDFPPPPPSPC
ncbi:hypothetical protein F3Y22_tig00110328pilonHSYRG01172 [Hibiscus syriacus]|uniref:Uncharacterized protein n=1 Tax=Hibiscus syriacus TaxID=106335 RepID=A0A6A3B440_HIBSY|nr:hypothetical protein F3Y22_tig00110328pilonHSYRG01172 [Hibiscus syriacus]